MRPTLGGAGGPGAWPMVALALSSFFCQAAVFAARPAISYRAVALHADPLLVGLMAAAFAALPLVTAIPIGSWVDRRTGRPALLLGGTLLIVDCFALAHARGPLELTVESAVLGLGHVLMAVGSQAIAASGRSGSHDAAFAWLTVGVSAGQLAGPVLLAVGSAVAAAGGLGGGEGFGADEMRAVMEPAALAALLSTITAMLVRSRRRQTATAARPSVSIRGGTAQILRLPTMPTAMLASIAVLSSIDILSAYLPVYAEEVGISVTAVSALLAVRAGSSLVVRLMTGRLLRRLGRRRTLLAAVVAPALGFGLYPVVAHTALAYLVMGLVGAGLGLGQPLTMAWVTLCSPTHLRGLALGVRLAGNRLGQLVAPAGMGLVAGSLGVTSVFFVLLTMLGATSVVVRRASFEALAPTDS